MPEPSSPAPFPPPPPKRSEPPAGRKLPCVQCGARLDSAPKATALRWAYCGHTQKIEKGHTEVAERALEEYLSRQSGQGVMPGRKAEVKCQTCAAVVLLEEKVASDRCPYCGTFLESKPEAA